MLGKIPFVVNVLHLLSDLFARDIGEREQQGSTWIICTIARSCWVEFVGECGCYTMATK